MAKYIDADDIKNDIKTLWDWETVDGVKSSTVLKQVLSDIDNLNEAVVQCKDCKYWEYKCQGDFNFIYGDCLYWQTEYDVETTGNDFCSYGERRESDD